MNLESLKLVKTLQIIISYLIKIMFWHNINIVTIKTKIISLI